MLLTARVGVWFLDTAPMVAVRVGASVSTTVVFVGALCVTIVGVLVACVTAMLVDCACRVAVATAAGFVGDG